MNQDFEKITLDGKNAQEIRDLIEGAVKQKACIYFLDYGEIHVNSEGIDNILNFNGKTIIYKINTRTMEKRTGDSIYDISYRITLQLKELFIARILDISKVDEDLSSRSLQELAEVLTEKIHKMSLSLN